MLHTQHQQLDRHCCSLLPTSEHDYIYEEELKRAQQDGDLRAACGVLASACTCALLCCC